MNLTRYKARLAFLTDELRREMNELPRGPHRADLMNELINLAYVNRSAPTLSPAVLDAYIDSATELIIGASMARAFPKVAA